MRRNFFVLMPSFESFGGHEVEFLKPLKLFASKKKLDLIYLLPKKNLMKFKEKNIKCFFGNKKNSLIKKLFGILLNLIKLKKFFAKNLKQNDIIYLDGFSIYFLISFIIFYFFLKKESTKLIVWLRYPYQNSIKNMILKFFINQIKNPKETVYLTENDNLRNKLKKNFKLKNIYTMPSLHNLNKYKKTKNKYNSKIPPVVLCPGIYREEKFGNNLNFFLTKNYQNNFQLRISENFKKKIEKSDKLKNLNINFIKENLNHKLHIKEITNCDIILLPYQMPDYKYRTSGLFFETISMNKITLITSGTLMAEDLKKFNLQSLSISRWKNIPFKKILNLLNNKKINKNLLKFSNYYNKINGIKPFTNKLLNVCDCL